MSKPWNKQPVTVRKKDLLGALAKWSIRMYPHGIPPRFMESLKQFSTAWPKDTRTMTPTQLMHALHDVFKRCPAVLACSVPSKGRWLRFLRNKPLTGSTDYGYVDRGWLAWSVAQDIALDERHRRETESVGNSDPCEFKCVYGWEAFRNWMECEYPQHYMPLWVEPYDYGKAMNAVFTLYPHVKDRWLHTVRTASGDRAMFICRAMCDGWWPAETVVEDIRNAPGKRANAIIIGVGDGWWPKETAVQDILDSPGDRNWAISEARRDGWWPSNPYKKRSVPTNTGEQP